MLGFEMQQIVFLSLQELFPSLELCLYSNQPYPRLPFRDLLSKLCEAGKLLISRLIKFAFQNIVLLSIKIIVSNFVPHFCSNKAEQNY